MVYFLSLWGEGIPKPDSFTRIKKGGFYMLKKGMLIFAVALTFLIYPAVSFSGACDPSPGQPEQRLIDGPANVRNAPSSKGAIIASLPNKKKVTVTKHEIKEGKDWYFIEWKEADQKKSGWTFVNNIICD